MLVPGGNAFLGSQNQVVLGEQKSFPALFFLWRDLVIPTGHPLSYDEVFIFQIYGRIKEQRAHLERPTPCFFWSAAHQQFQARSFFSFETYQDDLWPTPSTISNQLSSGAIHVHIGSERVTCHFFWITCFAPHRECLSFQNNNMLLILAKASALGCHLCSHGCTCCINQRFLWSPWSCSLPLPMGKHMLQV